ncbi:AraC family transcriptional regulator [Leclercia adecarboxylata]|uniref:AraC family transcriptional regulator n=1 Tax=Leclercia adecarboxylata TaxID=83655 RepID=UPI0013C7D1BF|nr:helix-turn-helix transcriptional regulator [Leclercia adecarboxylata]NEG94632.1 helix-turn-helix domain-containing protein [Leclercia adecarboxylata]
MTTQQQFSFATRPLVPFAHDYTHGETEPWHSHTCAQLLHTLSGVVRVETAQGFWIVPPGRGVWLPAGTQHRLLLTGNVAARTLFIDPFARADLPSVCQVVQISTLLRELILASLHLPESYAAGSRAERIYELILDEIRGISVLPFNLPEPETPALLALCRQIQAEPGARWTTALAASQLNISERTLLRHFRQQTGLAFSEWLRRARLMEALNRLAQGQSVLRVALDLGYESHSAFSAMFRRTLGVTPSDYFQPESLSGNAFNNA